ncbi:hypothetical protein T484DRAFT_3541250 [Baffinella frigidus]|nr:hypothetical protein T484DRAFT_3541250 [Cryptophyta sp. CCMP2293]
MAAQPTMRSKDTMQLLAAGCAALVVVGLCLAAHSGPVSLSETGVEPVFELSPREARGGASFPAQMRRTMFKARTAQLNVRDEGSTAQAYPEWARNGDMRREAQDDTGLPGWEPGSDYYSTRSWDNAPVKPPAGIKYFDPYVGEYGCPDCGGGVTKQFVYVFTVDASCEGAKGTRNINSVLHNAIGPNPFTSAAWATVKYHDLTWAEQQLAYLLTFYDARQLTLIIPPCFFPRFSVRAGGLLNQAVVDRGLKMLVVGGLTGASFLSDFMAGPEGVGYVDTTASSIDVVWTEGPFYMSNAATNTEFFYGPHVLPGPSCLGA